MAKWIPCGTEFVTGDVLRWGEAVWKPKKRQTDKGVRIGARAIIAQVTSCGPEWAELKVMHCEIAMEPGWAAEGYKRDETLRRRRAPMGRNGAERRLWPDETARPSRFRAATDDALATGLSGSEARKAHGAATRTRQGKFRRRKKGPRLRPGLR
jgi:hypothetical protein